VSRLIGEANLIDEEEADSPVLKTGDRLLVKKLGKEFIIKLHDVEWMESAGNYVNLHINERIYPIRKPLSTLAEEISAKGFCRVHRSHAINLDCVDSITPLPSGDGEVKLKSGKVLNISRRYKEELKQRLL
jgi:DNA-binding LytR/AlgR family response regulator